MLDAVRGAIRGSTGPQRNKETGRHKYTAIPSASHTTSPVGQRNAQRAKLVKMCAATVVVSAIMFLLVTYGQSLGTASHACQDSGQCTSGTSHTWGQYSPYFSVPSAIDAAVPKGCWLTFGLVLSRHGSRWPTAGKAEVYRSLVQRIQRSVQQYAPGYDFIQDYDMQLGVDDLTPFGEQEMVDSGAAFFHRYEELAKTQQPFLRASGSDRVVMSAQNFSHGFYAAQGKSGDDEADHIQEIPEGDGFNNTLDHGSCPAFENGPDSDLSHRKQAAWMEIWAAPIMSRMNEKLPGANLTLQETVLMMDLCPFETVATAQANMSDFCRLFTRDEWRGYDYFQSLGKWYGYGNGNGLGPTQGVGYVNELIARLTGQSVKDGTTTNSTLDSSPETFPLNRQLYADFSHDNSLTSVYAALGLYNATQDLLVKYRLSPRQTHGYSASWTVPFAARMYVEKMRCGARDGAAQLADKGAEADGEELVRILVNDRVVPLQGCGSDRLGRCRLTDFVESLGFARGGGRWDTCFT
ncbi:hypothetical protein CDD82_5637 [Ophiocordyceps australis]|uniref:Phytase A n=1 Tax=Ophiocordyceps australis TaxID=1399860 RepID=A0A2C5YWK3_9HYPO|nr:hypothetical protein CDD82_5637 [Ophiocordyceps australis]